MNEFIFKSYGNSKQSISYCEVDKCEAVIKLQEQLDQLKAENERLKKEIRLYDCIDKWGTEQCRCACRCLSNEFCDAAEEKMKNIKQTLAKIKEICKKESGWVNCSDNKPTEAAQFAQQILQKISEVEK